MARKIIKVQAEEGQGLLDLSHIPGLKAIPLKTRRFIQYEFDFTAEHYIPSLDPEELKDAVVKVNIRVKAEEAHRLNWIKDMEAFIRKHAFHLKPIVPSLIRTKKVRNKRINADISALDAIKYWVDDKKPKYASEILEIAEEILREN
jgi:hypothetical protein